MITAYFNSIRKKILEEISHADQSIKIAVAWFTNYELFEAILQKCKKKVSVELIIIKDTINLNQFMIKTIGIIKFALKDIHLKARPIEETSLARENIYSYVKKMD